jgi:hypothetical protein
MKQIKRSVITVILILSLLSVVVVADEAYSTQNDPLVSLSYVNDVLGPQIMAQVMERVEKEYIKVSDVATLNAAEMKLVTLNKDQTLMTRGVCEIMLISGNATVLVTSSANVSSGQGFHDVTDAKILVNGSSLPINHYTVVPKADGRGFYVTSSTAVVLIRGEYDITE